MSSGDRPVVVTLGETMAMLAGAQVGSLAHAPTVTVGIGGAESNVAIGLARLGVPVAWVGRVGNDSFGDLVLRVLRGENIHVVAHRDGEAPTGLMVKEQRTAVATQVWYYRRGSAGSRLSVDDLPDDVIADAEVLHLSGITPALSDSAATAVQRAVEVARSAGTTISFDVNYRSQLWSPAQAAQALRPLVEVSDVLFAGVEEAAMFVENGTDVADGTDEAELAHALAALGPREVIIKRGAAGALALVEGKRYRQDAVPVEVVDTVGAGDAFIAGYLAERLAGADIQTRLRTGALVGAWACTVRSDWQGLPTRRDLGTSLSEIQVVR
jgi:2-dehydro-3-deoxygluconokinase